MRRDSHSAIENMRASEPETAAAAAAPEAAARREVASDDGGSVAQQHGSVVDRAMFKQVERRPDRGRRPVRAAAMSRNVGGAMEAIRRDALGRLGKIAAD